MPAPRWGGAGIRVVLQPRTILRIGPAATTRPINNANANVMMTRPRVEAGFASTKGGVASASMCFGSVDISDCFQSGGGAPSHKRRSDARRHRGEPRGFEDGLSFGVQARGGARDR